MKMNIHEKETGMNDADALNTDEPLLFTPKAMDSLKKSIALLRQDAKDFTAGRPDYYRLICGVALDNLVPHLETLQQAGLCSAGMPPKEPAFYADDAKKRLEHCYADACNAHSLLWELYDFNADSGRCRDEIDSLAKKVLIFLRGQVLRLSTYAECFYFVYQVPMDFVPNLFKVRCPTLFICGECSQACLDKKPEKAAAWLDRLASDCLAAHTFASEHPSLAASISDGLAA